MHAKSSEKDRAITLRKEGKTYSEILKEVPVAKSTLSLWLRSVGLSKPQKQFLSEKRKAAQRKGANARYRMRVEGIETITKAARADVGTLSRRERWLVGAALYWAEGSKQHDHLRSVGVSFSNSDVAMHIFFLKWLREIGVANERIGFELYVHSNRKAEALQFLRWWLTMLGLPEDTHCPLYYKNGLKKTNRKNTGDLYRGLLRIKVQGSANLNRQIMGWVQGICS